MRIGSERLAVNVIILFVVLDFLIGAEANLIPKRYHLGLLVYGILTCVFVLVISTKYLSKDDESHKR